MKVLVDFSNLASMAFFSALSHLKIKPEETPEGFRNHIQTFNQKLTGFLSKFHWDELWFVLDSRPQYKYDIFPEYKAGRKRIKFDPKPAIFELLKSWNSNMIVASGYEADDGIATFTAKAEGDILILSSDKDLWQLLKRPQTWIFSMYNNQYTTQDALQEAFELDSFKHISLYKTLWGDAGDGVPNLAPRQKKHLLPVVKETDGTLASFYECLARHIVPEKCREMLEANKEKILINQELVSLNTDCQLTMFQARDLEKHVVLRKTKNTPPGDGEQQAHNGLGPEAIF
jgi:5'-3' exonuclease